MGVEFIFTGPIFDAWSWVENVAWARIALHENGKRLHHLHFIVKPGDTVNGFLMIKYMEILTQMYMSTNRGLN